MTYQVTTTGGLFLDLLSKDDLYNLNKQCITIVSKSYYPINEAGIRSNVDSSIILFSRNFLNETPKNYIENYTSNVEIYGVNAIDEDDIHICNYFNDNVLKRKRTRSIDYEIE